MANPDDTRSAADLGIGELLAEDFATYDRDPFAPGFWAVGAHRIGACAAKIESLPLRAVGVGICRMVARAVDWKVGIDIPPSVNLGRRVTIWHSGGISLAARSIGDDVHIRQSTTLGALDDRDAAPALLPVIESRADIGSGTCVLGPVTVGHDAVVGANSVVLEDVPPGANVLGVPARTVPVWSIGARSNAADGSAKDEGLPLPPGDRNENPPGVSLSALLAEDFRTHGGTMLSAGFWALAVHRIGNWRMGIRAKAVRAPLTLWYRAAHQSVITMWGIDLPYNAKLGRRLRIGHHGTVLMGVRQVGDDVQIRGAVTMGLRRRADKATPAIGDRVRIESNACIIGNIQIGDDSVIGPNTVLARDVLPGSTMLGIPGRRIDPAQYGGVAADGIGGAAGAGAGQGRAVGGSGLAVAIVILNYRTPDMTCDCLDSLRGEIRPGIQVVVVDNASGDGSADKIAAHIQHAGFDAWARVLRSDVNGGFAAGNNLGIRETPADAYLLLNSDTIVRPGAIAALRAAMTQHPRAGMIGPGLVGATGNVDRSCFRFPHPISEFIRAANTGLITKILGRYDVPLPFFDTPIEPEWIGFACVLIRREVIEQVGLLDPGYFMYFEDIDYCRKVCDAGWTILYWPEPKVVHFMGGTSNITSADEVPRRAARYFYEARSRYFAKHHGMVGLLTANLLWTTGRVISWSREVVQRRPRQVRDHEVVDIWINVLDPLRASRYSPPPMPGTRDDVAASRDRNANPADLGLADLLREDFTTHGGDPLAPGFWALAVFRFGNWSAGVRPWFLGRALLGLHSVMSTSVDWLWGINLGQGVKVGRRVRIWRHGGMILDAREIGDDVQIRPSTTFGAAGRTSGGNRPIIQDRVNLGIGVSVIGDVTVGHDSVIGPNAVVLASCAPHARLSGVPARPMGTPRSAPSTQALEGA